MPEENLNNLKDQFTGNQLIDSSIIETTIITNSEIKDKGMNSNNYSEKEKDLFFQLALKELKDKRDSIEKEINELSTRKEKLEMELKNTFTGQSDVIARRMKGFQDFLSGALQDLSKSAEQMNLGKQTVILQPSPLDAIQEENRNDELPEIEPAISDIFKPDELIIRECFKDFLGQPDFYAEPWKLRRSLEQKDIDILSDWFFSMGGRGAQPSLGNRAKNILLSAGLISILGELYGERFQTLVLAGQPERLGEWRRGLQDALGLGREDFGPASGIVLFERADGVIDRADRLEERNEVPLIIVDSSEQYVDIQILQFPLWLAFAPGPNEIFTEEDYL
tara:strand:+ start:1362 stop:2369 length:1008 start_codon:yes stop_codon:yes gene_type:complete